MRFPVFIAILAVLQSTVLGIIPQNELQNGTTQSLSEILINVQHVGENVEKTFNSTTEEHILFRKVDKIVGVAINPTEDIRYRELFNIDLPKPYQFGRYTTDYDSREGYVYFSCYSRSDDANLTQLDNALFRVPLNGNMSEIIIPSPVNSLVEEGNRINGASFDWITKNLYYIDGAANTLNAINIKQPCFKMIVLTDLKNASTVVVHPPRGYIFICESLDNVNFNISRISVDGRYLRRFPRIFSGITGTLAIDYHIDRIYWYNGFDGTVISSNLNGNEIKVLANIKVTDIAISKNYIYMVYNPMSQDEQSTLYIYDKSGKEQRKLNVSELEEITVFSINNQIGDTGLYWRSFHRDCNDMCFPAFPSWITNLDFSSSCDCLDPTELCFKTLAKMNILVLLIHLLIVLLILMIYGIVIFHYLPRPLHNYRPRSGVFELDGLIFMSLAYRQ